MTYKSYLYVQVHFQIYATIMLQSQSNALPAYGLPK